MINLNIKSKVGFLIFIGLLIGCNKNSNEKPNILWIVAEDASCHLSCYGETAIQTSNIDKLATDGIRFEKAFVTASVCSPSRSAMATGMVQNSFGAHNHRSQVYTGRGGGNTDYFSSFPLPLEVTVASKLFEKAGYYTCNENLKGKKGKEDYNFMDDNTFNGTNWKDTPLGKPFFAQIQLKGGKNRKRLADTEDFKLPPYYFEDSIMRNDWKEYLGSWLDTDDEIKKIVADLKEADVYDNTMIVFLTDHGISHLRGKQFLYDEGIQVPMIVKLPKGIHKETVRKDMVTQIDILPVSLAVAGIPIPENIQGKNIFAKDYQKQEYTFAFRDRCDETTELIRSVRSEKYKYIRNFLSYRPHTQRNQYKDGKEISKHMRALYSAGELNELQSRFYQATRPTEELYDLENDPYETNNLAGDPKYKAQLDKMRLLVYNRMTEIHDAGIIPEPILEDLGKKYGNKYKAMRQSEYADIQRRLIQVIEAGENGDVEFLMKKTKSNDPSERYWAVTWLGVNKAKEAKDGIVSLLSDENPSVRIAANLTYYKIDTSYNPVSCLGKELDNSNLLVGMYAMNAIEQTGILNNEVKSIAEKAMNSKYEFTKRFGKYLVTACNMNK